MTGKLENPPAFPTEFVKHKSGEIGNNVDIYAHGEGMTLRDYFAAKALQGIIAHEGGDIGTWCCEASYKYADAMLKARQS